MLVTESHKEQKRLAAENQAYEVNFSFSVVLSSYILDPRLYIWHDQERIRKEKETVTAQDLEIKRLFVSPLFAISKELVI